MYIDLHIALHVPRSVYLHIFVHIYMYTYSRTHIYWCMYTYSYTYVSVYLHIFVHIYSVLYMCTNISNQNTNARCAFIGIAARVSSSFLDSVYTGINFFVACIVYTHMLIIYIIIFIILKYKCSVFFCIYIRTQI